jgi:hypothetical protein
MEKSKVYLLACLLLVVFFLTSCQTFELAGHYVANESYGTDHDLSLNKDSSFQYVIKEGLACDTILGYWQVDDNKQLILVPNKKESYLIQTDCDTCAGIFYIKTYALPDNYEMSMPYIKVYAKGHVIESGITNSVKDIIMQKADSVQINYFGFEPYVFIPQKKRNAIIDVFLVEEQQRLLQKDKKLKIKKNKFVTESGMKLKKQF